MALNILKDSDRGLVEYNHNKVISEQVMQRWDELGFLTGLKGQNKTNMAHLFENQANWLLKDGRHILNEATSLGSEGSFETVVFPLVRRIFSNLLANEIVSVQALNLPIGKLFYFIPRIGRSKFNATGVNQMEMVESFDSNGNLYDAFYNNALFDKSKGKATSLSGVTTGTAFTYAKTGDGFSSLGSVTALAASGGTTIVKVNFSGATLSDTHVEEILSTLGSTTTGLTINLAAQKYGTAIFPATKDIYLSITTSPTQAAVNLTGLTITGKTYASLEAADEMGELSFTFSSVTIEVTERKLRVQWTPELAQDVERFQNIDAEAELTAMMSEQVAAEIDREILRDLIVGAAWVRKWDYKGSSTDMIAATGSGASNLYTQKTWNQTLITVINRVSSQIHKSTLKGGATWAVTSTEVCNIFNDLETFYTSNADPEQDNFNMGIQKIGSIQNRYTVYQDPYFPPNVILLGRKGSSTLDAGYIYAPYIPVTMTPVMYNPSTGVPTRMLMTRYGKHMVNNRFYGVVVVENLPTFDNIALR